MQSSYVIVYENIAYQGHRIFLIEYVSEERVDFVGVRPLRVVEIGALCKKGFALNERCRLRAVISGEPFVVNPRNEEHRLGCVGEIRGRVVQFRPGFFFFLGPRGSPRLEAVFKPSRIVINVPAAVQRRERGKTLVNARRCAGNVSAPRTSRHNDSVFIYVFSCAQNVIAEHCVVNGVINPRLRRVVYAVKTRPDARFLRSAFGVIYAVAVCVQLVPEYVVRHSNVTAFRPFVNPIRANRTAAPVRQNDSGIPVLGHFRLRNADCSEYPGGVLVFIGCGGEFKGLDIIVSPI